MTKLTNDVQVYWQERAKSYGKQHQNELIEAEVSQWQSFIKKRLQEARRPIKKILDIGTGPGFLAIIIAKMGYDVTAIDLTDEMLTEAKANAIRHQVNINFRKMNALDLQFAPNEFDAIVTRNLTWNLDHPEQAYAHWLQYLQPNGVLLNFDANWYTYLYDQKQADDYQASRKKVHDLAIADYYAYQKSDLMEELAKQMPLSQHQRPAWDIQMLQQLAPTKINIYFNLNDELLTVDQQINFASTPLFCVCTHK